MKPHRSDWHLGLLGTIGLSVAACSGPTESPPAAADLGATPDSSMAVRGKVTGAVIDLNHMPLPGVSVKLCGSPCRAVTTDAMGMFEFTDVAQATYGIHVELPGAVPSEYGKVVLPLYYYDPVQTPVRALPPTVVPRLGTATDLLPGPQSVSIDAQLALTLDQKTLSLPPDAAMARVAGVRVPQGIYPDFCLPSGDGRIIAEWALGPFDARSSAPISVHIADNLGLAPSSSVNLMSVDPETGRPQQEGLGKVSADGKSIDSLSAMGLRRLTWLIVTLPGGGP